ncbi:MAG: di-trans,poly-cis-decaprenylcistransferase [Candidatus Nealsonbacteria bacterium CG10_big_fil_rev_8_21_14_0_10_36_24]|uniref:Isoprenyl transferase n=2 Tax=Candidatus Nealsoniibacteriota TaxID=1817911 RepID=A0A2H0YP33_9BACT|nr:MAG: di-trans,poly-cis-decaprenylcistransferase [Candidatus Nealsonbacteria bacterium CG10_big_fil_rev_8_21_14_0_10_36_24]PIS40238.1 MAG: di-trans,poly-cis-decaprenylcistransferase [Candidatus Nealsonbacteria bacterium CG08_land_8_20_14_0_20_36_22]
MPKVKIPYHLGIIIDGNRRWAREKGLPVFEGHKRGLKKIKEVIKWCRERRVKILTFFVFSTENWKRSKMEVSYLMKLAQEIMKNYIKEARKERIKIKIIGQKEKLPRALAKAIKNTEELTKNNKEMTVNFALSYGGRLEITEAVKNIIKKRIPPEKITEEVISENLWTSDLDLLIRTGKEQRLSNFLIWQVAYSELYFTKKYWPDFTEKDLEEAFEDFSLRQRRFGK